jgi:hypothetical protein
MYVSSLMPSSWHASLAALMKLRSYVEFSSCSVMKPGLIDVALEELSLALESEPVLLPPLAQPARTNATALPPPSLTN